MNPCDPAAYNWPPETAALLAASHALTTADDRAHLAEQTGREQS